MIQGRLDGEKLIITISGKIDYSNAKTLEAELRRMCLENSFKSIELDCDRLEYSSSAELAKLLPQVDTLVI
jgi:anti-anti-sigma factor